MANWFHSGHYGLKINNDDIGGILGKEFGPGKTINVGYFNTIYKNYRVSDDGVSGDVVTKNQSSSSPMYEYTLQNKAVLPFVFPDNWSLVDTSVEAYRICGILQGPSTGLYEGKYTIRLMFQPSNSTGTYLNGFNVRIDGSGNYSVTSRSIPDSLFVTDDLGSSSAPATGQTKLSIITSGLTDNYASRLSSADYFDYNEVTYDFPVFDTEEHAKAYLNDHTNETYEGILNAPSPDYEEEYLLDQKFYFIHNSFTHYYRGTTTKYWRNYRFKPGYDSKIRLYREKPSTSRYYTMVLIVPGGMTRFKAPEGDYNESSFELDEDTLQTHYCEYSFQISRVNPRDEIEVTSPLKTNIPIWGSREDATKYANDELSIEDALNYSDILAFENQLPQPEFGEEDAETETGINGQTYMAGSAVYVLTRPEMIKFFTEIFKIQDPSFINAFKDGNLLFGDNQANAIIGCMYFPFDAAEVCSLESSSGPIWVGGWQSQTATGRKVNMNDKVLTVGEFFLSDMYQDVRDYEPYTQLFVQLPYCGTYQLSIQKYINKTVKINYAVDIFTGACTALIYANNILLDSMDGMMGSQRPVTGRTAANMLQAITRGSASTIGATAAGMKGASVLAGAGQAVFEGGESIAALGIGAGTQTAMASGALALGAGAVGVAGAGIGAVAGVDMMYKAKNAYADPPMSTRGQYSGNLAMFSNQKVHFIVAMRHSYRPENEGDIYGYPSGRGGLIGSFSGFLRSSCVQLADGFVGSVQERNEILQMIAKGIYI